MVLTLFTKRKENRGNVYISFKKYSIQYKYSIISYQSRVLHLNKTVGTCKNQEKTLFLHWENA